MLYLYSIETGLKVRPMIEFREYRVDLTMSFNYPNRLVCDVLREMRELVKAVRDADQSPSHRPYTMLLSLIEEVQVYVNRMEAGLEYSSDLEKLHEKRAEARAELKSLTAKLKEMRKLTEISGKNEENGPESE